jgi:hypothetical protein
MLSNETGEEQGAVLVKLPHEFSCDGSGCFILTRNYAVRVFPSPVCNPLCTLIVVGFFTLLSAQYIRSKRVIRPLSPPQKGLLLYKGADPHANICPSINSCAPKKLPSQMRPSLPPTTHGFNAQNLANDPWLRLLRFQSALTGAFIFNARIHLQFVPLRTRKFELSASCLPFKLPSSLITGHGLFYVFPSLANTEKVGVGSRRRPKEFGKAFEVFFYFLCNLCVCLFSILVQEREIDWVRAGTYMLWGYCWLLYPGRDR